MRQIKFRVYDKINKIFIEDLSNFWINPTFTFMKEFRDDLDGETIFELSNTLEFQQFTGILDKNGKEIYDGDIVLAPFYGEDRKDLDKMIVTWYNNSWCLNANSGCYGGVFIYYVKNNIEVIGNIFETPELIIGEM